MRFFLNTFLIFLFLAAPAYAQETQPGDACSTAGLVRHTGGSEQMPNHILICNGTNWLTLTEQTTTGKTSLQVGNDAGSCTAAKTGRVRYDGSSTWTYCNGSAWAAFDQAGGSSGCTAPASCPNIGDVCSDGSLFAGFVMYNNSSCEALYVTDADQSTSIRWRSSSSGNDINPDDFADGRANHANITVTLATLPAIQLCDTNTYHSKSDWYLPSREELGVLWENRAAINANAAGSFASAAYPSSSEFDNAYAWIINFADGIKDKGTKVTLRRARCVRRD